MEKTEGYCKDEQCNRDGCIGIIEYRESEGSCSCHINPPCCYCTDKEYYCPLCHWESAEDQREYDKVQQEIYKKNEAYYQKQNAEHAAARELFYKKYNGEIPTTEFEYRKESHTHFSMAVFGIHPAGFDLSTVMDKIRGTFGGRFEFKSETKFKYIAYTD